MWSALDVDMILFDEGERSVVNCVRSALPDRFSTEEDIENNHRLFKDEDREEGVAVNRVENIREKYYEVHMFEEGVLRDSKRFEDINGVVEFLESEY